MLSVVDWAWEKSDMSDTGDLRGRALYDALMLLKPPRLPETEWAINAGLNKGFFTNLKSSDGSPRSDNLRKLLSRIGKSEEDLYRVARGEVLPDIPPTYTSSFNDGPVKIRMLDLNLSMGDGSDLDHYAEEEAVDFDPNVLRRLTNTPAERLYLARGSGDSMFPTLVNGDMVLIDPNQTVLNLDDRIWAISLFGAGGIKRLQPVAQGRIEVISDNPLRNNRVVDADDIRILGRVIWIGREV